MFDQRAYLKEWRKKNRDKMRDYERKATYGLTPEQWIALCADGCGICGGRRNLVPDHDHTTGAVRGALCKKCNTGLGQFNDNPALLKKALAWLEK